MKYLENPVQIIAPTILGILLSEINLDTGKWIINRANKNPHSLHSVLQTRDAQLTMYVHGSRKGRARVCFTINRDIVIEIGKWHEGQGLNVNYSTSIYTA